VGDGQRRRRPSSLPDKSPSSTQLQTELAALRAQVRDLSATVGTLKDILQVKDNWHRHVSRMVGKQVFIVLPSDARLKGTLLWTDRYNLSIDHNDQNDGKQFILNKGQILGIYLVDAPGA